MISAKPHVQIQDIVIRHVQEKTAVPELNWVFDKFAILFLGQNKP